MTSTKGFHATRYKKGVLNWSGLSFFSPLIFLLTCFSCGTERPGDKVIIGIQEVINKRPAQVVALLGDPDTTYTEMIVGRPLFCQRYRRYNIEIQYPEGLSSDIVVHGPHGLPFAQHALKAFNLPVTQHPSQYEKDAVMRWYDVGDFEAISFYDVRKNSGGEIANFKIFFKAKTPAEQGELSSTVK